MRRAATLALALAVVALAGWVATRSRRALVVTSLGPVSRVELRLVARDLARCYHRPVRTLPALALPPAAHLVERGQWDADALLARLDQLDLDRGERLVALCDADGTTRDRTFVLGLAGQGGRSAVVFLPRLRAAVDADRYARRLTVTARHEVGHLLGLVHCDGPGCAMRFSSSAVDTDAKGPELCERCRRQVRWAESRGQG